jgi:phage tail sheath protein FI
VINQPVAIHSFAGFEREFGGLWEESTMSYAVRDFFANGGTVALIVRVGIGVPTTDDYLGNESDKTGLYALERADHFNLLCIPPPTRDTDTDPSVYDAALTYCEKRRAMLIVDPPIQWDQDRRGATGRVVDGLSALGLTGTKLQNAALYFPRVQEADPERDGQTHTFIPCGVVAGIIARVDSRRGVWRAPAGLEATAMGVQGLQIDLTDRENGELTPQGVNCLRSFPETAGPVVWGARTLAGADEQASDWKYIPVCRLALFIEESLFRGTKWVVFEPNDESLWAQIRLIVGAFMQNLFRQGALPGSEGRRRLSRKMRLQNDDAGRLRSRRREHRGRLRAVKAGRVRDYPDSTACRADPELRRQDKWRNSRSIPVASIRTRTSSFG